MTTLVESVRSRVPKNCISTRCQAKGCSANVGDAPTPFVLVDMDCRTLSLNQSSSRCDFIFVTDSGDLVAALELKRGKVEASQVVRQLQAGADFADSVVPKRSVVRFVPIAVYGGKAHRGELTKLGRKQSQIRFRSSRVRIELLRCGQPLVNAIRKAAGD